MDGGARFEWTLRVAGAGAAEMAWEEATGERGLSGRLEWGWSCRNGMGGEWTLRVAGAGAAEMAGFFLARSCLGQVPGGGAPFSQRSELATACTSRMQIKN